MYDIDYCYDDGDGQHAMGGEQDYDCTEVAMADDCPLPDPNVPLRRERRPYVQNRDKSRRVHSNDSAICAKNLEQINNIIGLVGPFTTIDEFMIRVAEFTSDNGETMMDVVSNELGNFKDFIKELYTSRNDNVGQLLRTEHKRMKNKYERLARELQGRRDIIVQKLKRLFPGFEWAAYLEAPSTYFNTLLQASEQGTRQGDPQESIKAERRNRVALHEKSWLLKEAERAECANDEQACALNQMMDQLAQLTDNLSHSNNKTVVYNQQLKNHAECLKNKLAYNENIINRMKDELELNRGETEDECRTIEPEDILPPFTNCDCY